MFVQIDGGARGGCLRRSTRSQSQTECIYLRVREPWHAFTQAERTHLSSHAGQECSEQGVVCQQVVFSSIITEPGNKFGITCVTMQT